jgi:DNA-binding response OmpR family regulator
MTDTALYSVLLVDDNAAMREALARSLARRGCRVTTATTGVDALATVRERSFDAVITDLNMPERGGLWLWRQTVVLRPELRGRFVMIASEPLPEPRSLALFMETEQLLVKPLSLDSLWRQVQDILQRAPKRTSGARAQPPDLSARL